MRKLEILFKAGTASAVVFVGALALNFLLLLVFPFDRVAKVAWRSHLPEEQTLVVTCSICELVAKMLGFGETFKEVDFDPH
jgi:hypothetical protein